MRWWLLAAGVAAYFVAADLVAGGLGTSNGRVISFLDSLHSAVSFRSCERKETSEVKTAVHGRAASCGPCAIFAITFLAKFGTATLGSLLLGATPVWLQGPRHVASWLLAFALVQLCPGDAVFAAVQQHPAVQLCIRCGCSLYKLRKFNFVALQAQGLAWTAVTQAIVIDGNSCCQQWWLRGAVAAARTQAARMLPLLAAAVVSHHAGSSLTEKWPVALGVLALMLQRHEVPRLFHQEGLSGSLGAFLALAAAAAASELLAGGRARADLQRAQQQQQQQQHAPLPYMG